jgi:hypothetical protein
MTMAWRRPCSIRRSGLARSPSKQVPTNRVCGAGDRDVRFGRSDTVTRSASTPFLRSRKCTRADRSSGLRLLDLIHPNAMVDTPEKLAEQLLALVDRFFPQVPVIVENVEQRVAAWSWRRYRNRSKMDKPP